MAEEEEEAVVEEEEKDEVEEEEEGRALVLTEGRVDAGRTCPLGITTATGVTNRAAVGVEEDTTDVAAEGEAAMDLAFFSLGVPDRMPASGARPGGGTVEAEGTAAVRVEGVDGLVTAVVVVDVVVLVAVDAGRARGALAAAGLGMGSAMSAAAASLFFFFLASDDLSFWLTLVLCTMRLSPCVMTPTTPKQAWHTRTLSRPNFSRSTSWLAHSEQYKPPHRRQLRHRHSRSGTEVRTRRARS